MPATVDAKKKCCKDKPRCKRCPVVLRRLAEAGLAKRTGTRTYEVDLALKRRHLTAARSNRPIA